MGGLPLEGVGGDREKCDEDWLPMRFMVEEWTVESFFRTMRVASAVPSSSGSEKSVISSSAAPLFLLTPRCIRWKFLTAGDRRLRRIATVASAS